MSVVINTNVDSLKIQNILAGSTNKLSQTMERMSTGLKVNSAKDDAAGAVISARMQVQLDGNQICQNNVQNGNALLSTAEGNIDVVLENVSRIRDLTLQAKNGTYSAEEIQAMQDEVTERMAEIDRVSQSSKYSQLQLFGDADMEANGISLQVGPNSSDDNVIAVSGDVFGSVEFNKITGRDGSASKEYVAPDAGTAVTAYTTKVVKADAKDALKEDGTLNDGYVALYKFEADGDDKLTKAGPVEYYKEDTTNGTALTGYAQVADATDVTAPTGLDLTTLDKDGFVKAIDDLDAAINNLTSRKSLIGSAQNRLDSALDTLTTQFENLSSAKSIITDADIAAEASNFTQQQILQQVSTSLLAQANQAPSIALSLV